MAVSKKRHQHTRRERRRQRERCEVKERATHRQHRFAIAVNDLCEADGRDEVRTALQRVEKIAPDKNKLLSAVLDAEPADILAHRRGWKLIAENQDYCVEQVWIFTPTIPENWDESSTDRPTSLVWEGFYTVIPAVRGGASTHDVTHFDNPFRLIREISSIESW